MPRSFWRSADAVAQLNQLERAGFALEFLRRNPAYRDDYARMQRHIAHAASIPRRRAPTLPDDGGCVFAYDPRSQPGTTMVLWRPEVFPGVCC